MSQVNNSIVALAAPELLKAMTGSFVAIGTLLYNPTIIIFDNQSTSSGATTWKTFPAGEALILDLRAAHGIASNYSFRIGTVFSGNGTATGNFSIAYTYAESF